MCSRGVVHLVAKRIRQAAETVIAQDSIFPDTEEVDTGAMHWLINALMRYLRCIAGSLDRNSSQKQSLQWNWECERIEDVAQTLVLIFVLADF